jgi:hypothetical protein
MIKDIEFCELLNVRFYHDISGAIGTIRNSLDLLHNNNKDIQRQAFDLLQSSSESALNSIAFFKTAYGAIATDEINLHTVKELVNKFFDRPGMSISFVEQHQSLEPRIVKLLLNVLLISASLITYQGNIYVNINNDSSIHPTIVITSTAKSYKPDREIVNILRGASTSEVDIQNVQHFYTYRIAQGIEYAISIIYAEQEIKISLSKVRLYA